MLKCSQHNWERHSNFRAGDACSWGGQETSCWGSPWAALGPRHSVSERIEVSPGHQNGDRKEKKELPPTAIQRGAPLQYLHRIWTFVLSYFLRVTSADFERHIFKGPHFRSFFSTSLLWTVNTRKEFSRDWIKSIRKASTRRGLCVRPSWKSTARPRNSQTSRTDISRD